MFGPVRRNAARAAVKLFSVAIVTSILYSAVARESSAATKAERESAAKQDVQEALHREIYGQDQERAALLDRAAAAVSEFAPAMWHRGYVRWKNKWVNSADIPALVEDDLRVTKYRRIRGDYPLTAEGQLQLANWCAENKLPDRERAHFLAVLEIDANNAEAHRRLGDRRINGDWVTADELADAARQLAKVNESLDKWEGKFETVLKLLDAPSERKRESARKQILAVDESDAIPALEYHLAAGGEEAAKLAVEALGKFTGFEAAQALARLSTFSRWDEVRQAAAAKLRGYSIASYAPLLLANLYTPYTSRRAVQGRGDSLLYRHAFLREGQNEQELVVMDTSYRRVARVGGDGMETLSRIMSRATDTAGNRERTLARMNRRTAALNARVAAALNAATQQNLPADPKTWWQWWNDQNEIVMAGQKPVQVARNTQEIAVADFVPTPVVGGGAGGVGLAGGGQGRHECLAPGTLVWTAAGAVAVETVQVGDLVLAQHPDTGELAYKAVVRTTLRPKERLVRIEAGDSVIESSDGHPFWVSGEGWVLARDLTSGMELHCADGTRRITAIKEGIESETHNLIVDEFRTYFVGPHRVLSHDNTDRRPTNAVVPGLKAD